MFLTSPSATARRDEATQQKYSTLQYEAPEAITNMNLRVGRSRRYDIWSMGCIILEFVIWLLYGWEGLEAFYEQRNYIDRSTETLYFSADKQNGTAKISKYAKAWIDHMLRNDPECNNSSGSAIGDVIRVVRDKLLVVALPKQGMSETDIEQCRADAGQLETALRGVLRKALDDEEKKGRYHFSGSNRRNIIPPDLGQRRQSMSRLSTKDDRSRKPGEAAKNNLVKLN